MAIIKKNLQTINAGDGVEEREPFCTVGGNVTYAAIMENKMEIPRNKSALVVV